MLHGRAYGGGDGNTGERPERHRQSGVGEAGGIALQLSRKTQVQLYTAITLCYYAWHGRITDLRSTNDERPASRLPQSHPNVQPGYSGGLDYRDMHGGDDRSFDVLACPDARQRALILSQAAPMPVVIRTRNYGAALRTA